MEKVATRLERFRDELDKQLTDILEFWMYYTIDEQNGGFYGKVDNNNIPDPSAPKGLVLNARILWAFSAAYNLSKRKDYLDMAERAWQYIINYFLDTSYGGYYWSVDKEGHYKDSKKQVYGMAFCLYGFSEYYKATGRQNVLERARDCYHCIEKYSFDKVKGGYFEAFTRDWQPLQDLRLSTKDANEKKTMNTHLHLMEAYTNFYRVSKDDGLKKSIVLLIQSFIDHIINPESGHLQLFFDENWQVKADVISYGHDIEASWLLLEAAKEIADKKLIIATKKLSLKMADAAAEGFDTDGGLWYETELGQLVRQKHSWPQAEAIVGFYNAWQLSGDMTCLDYALDTWKFVKQHILDTKNGEWFWGVNDDHSVMVGQDKAGFWKCPYHNSRACIEIMQRMQPVQ